MPSSATSFYKSKLNLHWNDLPRSCSMLGKCQGSIPALSPRPGPTCYILFLLCWIQFFLIFCTPNSQPFAPEMSANVHIVHTCRGRVRRVDAGSYYFNLILHPIRMQDYAGFLQLYNFYATQNTGTRACKAILKTFLRSSWELEEQA